MFYSIAVPDPARHFEAAQEQDSDPACHFKADPEPTFPFYADPAPSFQIKAQSI
jgi:hypothetical protein